MGGAKNEQRPLTTGLDVPVSPVIVIEVDTAAAAIGRLCVTRWPNG
jgi:hypothetical protein